MSVIVYLLPLGYADESVRFSASLCCAQVTRANTNIGVSTQSNPSDASCRPTQHCQVLVIAHFLNSAVRVSIASGWNANPQLAKVIIRWKWKQSSDSCNGVELFVALAVRAHVYTLVELSVACLYMGLHGSYSMRGRSANATSGYRVGRFRVFFCCTSVG